jgi:hypothetical protein
MSDTNTPELDSSNKIDEEAQVSEVTRQYTNCEELNEIEAVKTPFFASKLMGNVAKLVVPMHASVQYGRAYRCEGGEEARTADTAKALVYLAPGARDVWRQSRVGGERRVS